MLKPLLAIALLSLTAVPLASAAEHCASAGVADACASTLWNERFKNVTVVAWTPDGTVVAADAGEGYGFFGKTLVSLVYVRDANTGQTVVLFASANDDHPTDGTYDAVGAGGNTWNDYGQGPAANVAVLLLDWSDADPAASAHQETYHGKEGTYAGATVVVLH